MVDKEMKCRDCGKMFINKKPTSRYTRKYCDKCSKQRKKDYENLYKVSAKDCDDEE